MGIDFRWHHRDNKAFLCGNLNKRDVVWELNLDLVEFTEKIIRLANIKGLPNLLHLNFNLSLLERRGSISLAAPTNSPVREEIPTTIFFGCFDGSCLTF